MGKPSDPGPRGTPEEEPRDDPDLAKGSERKPPEEAREPEGKPHEPKREEFPGASMLKDRAPKDVLRHITDGDPLGLNTRCSQRLLDRAMLIEPRRLVLRSLARVARAAVAYGGTPSLDTWLHQCIDRSIDELYREDLEEERRGIPVQKPFDARYWKFADFLGIEMSLARRMCNVFNSMEDEMRHVVFAVAIQGKTIHRYVAEGHGPPQKVQALLNEGLRRLRTMGSHGEDAGGPG